MKRRILHVIDHTGAGGAQVILYNLLHALRNSYSFAVAVLGASGRFSERIAALDVPVFHLGRRRSRWDPTVGFGLAEIIRSERFDLVHACLFKSLVIAPLAAIPTGTRVVLHDQSGMDPETLHYYFPQPMLYASYRLMYTTALARCDRVIVSSREALRRYEHSYPVSRQKIAIIPNGVNLSRFRERDLTRPRMVDAELGLSPSTKIVTMIGRLEREKDWMIFLRVAEYFQSRLAIDCVFLVVGTGSEEQALRSYASTHGLTRVHFLGHYPDALALLTQSDVFLLTSRRDYFPIVLLEAMAAGCGIVATRCGGPQIMLADEVDGLLADVGDAAGLAQRVARLLEDDALREILADRARRKVTEQYSLEAVAGRVDALYDEVLSL